MEGTHPNQTEFLPAGRSPKGEIERESKLFIGHPLLDALTTAFPDILLVLNKDRQIVFLNRAFLDFLGCKNEESLLGLRNGEAFDCVHASETDGGCGTTEFCRECGAAKAILASQKGRKDVQECRILRKDGDALDFRVWTTPLKVGDEPFTIFTVTDISHEKRRGALERIFFHDILNTAGGLYGFIEFLKEAQEHERDEYTRTVSQLAERLIEEIKAQRELAAAESGDLPVQKDSVGSLELIKRIANLYRRHEAANGRQLLIDPGAKDVPLVTDARLMGRVLGNLTKNALEASQPGQSVTLSCVPNEDRVEFSVHNPNPMPREIQLQVFQRSFSTKGAGRGLGTYSVKLLSERYLRGKVWFVISQEKGTTFKASYPLS